MSQPQAQSSNPLSISSYWFLSARSIIIETIAGLFTGEFQSEPVFLSGNGKSAEFDIHIRSQTTGTVVDTIKGSFQMSLTPKGTIDKTGNPEFLLIFASTWAGSSQATIVCPGGRFQGINEKSGTPFGLPFADIKPVLPVPGSKASESGQASINVTGFLATQYTGCIDGNSKIIPCPPGPSLF